jgi:hypothetical protein
MDPDRAGRCREGEPSSEEVVMRRLSLIVLCSCAFAAPALASGGAAPGVTLGWDGVADTAAGVRYVALPAGDRTAVAAVSMDSGRVDRYASIAGRYGVAFTTWTSTTGGLSPDRSTLVLQSVPVPALFQTVSRFKVLTTKHLRVTRTIVLRGDFSFDAISPGGRTLFLVEHIPGTNVTRYLVRAYDLRAGRLLRQVIADKEEPNMAGYPVARATRRDAAWVYTLYQQPGAHPFVHALDTVHRRAVCIDLKWTGTQEQVWKLHLTLRANGRRLAVSDPRGRTVETIDLAARKASP